MSNHDPRMPGQGNTATGLRHGGRILADQLAILGAEKVFCVPGESFLGLLDGLYDHAGQIEVITCRHESGASNMADAYGKLTGQAGHLRRHPRPRRDQRLERSSHRLSGQHADDRPDRAGGAGHDGPRSFSRDRLSPHVRRDGQVGRPDRRYCPHTGIPFPRLACRRFRPSGAGCPGAARRCLVGTCRGRRCAPRRYRAKRAGTGRDGAFCRAAVRGREAAAGDRRPGLERRNGRACSADGRAVQPAGRHQFPMPGLHRQRPSQLRRRHRNCADARTAPQDSRGSGPADHHRQPLWRDDDRRATA